MNVVTSYTLYAHILTSDVRSLKERREEIPQADVEITDKDPPEVRRIKEMIVQMTAYEAIDRPTIQQVLVDLAE